MRRKRNGSCCSMFKIVIRKCWKTFTKQLLEFCRETGLHGCKYICESQRSLLERVAWAIMVVASVSTAIGMLKVTYNYYHEHSILSVIESTHRGIWNYPFPAVTVCDFNRVSLKLTQKFVDNLTLPSTISKEFMINEMKLLDELLYPGGYGSQVRKNLSRLQIIFDMNKVSIPTVINSVTRNCQSLLESCKWKTVERDCSKLFQSSYTRDGMCCSFNYITNDTIKEKPKYILSYRYHRVCIGCHVTDATGGNNVSCVKPHKMTSCGYQSGLNILLNLDPSDYHASNMKSIGIKVILHDPYNYPDYDAPSKLIGLNKYAFLTVQPRETYSTKDIRNTHARDCAYHDELEKIIDNESQIYFMPERYSFINCLTNCRAIVIKNKCGCIPYYYPQNKIRVCNLRDSECLETFRFWYDTSWPGIDMSPKTLPLVELNTKERPCNCKPDCDFYWYAIENSAGNLDDRVYYNGLSYTTYPSKGKTWKNQSIVHIFFGDLVSIQFRRDMRYSWRHYFATFGGLLGVFAGISFMSMFEIIYFFIIRILTDACVKRHAKNVT